MPGATGLQLMVHDMDLTCYQLVSNWSLQLPAEAFLLHSCYMVKCCDEWQYAIPSMTITSISELCFATEVESYGIMLWYVYYNLVNNDMYNSNNDITTVLHYHNSTL